MLVWLALSLTLGNAMVSFDDAEDECIDRSPYCTANDCNVRPGYALEFCKKTCGNCEPFCYNSQIVPCKDSRKQECYSMLKDYCPLLCGVCRAKKRKLPKVKGVKSIPVSIAKLGILKKFSTLKPFRSTNLENNATSVPVIPTVTQSSTFSDGLSTPASISSLSTESGDSNLLAFSDTSSLESSPIVAEEDEKEGHNTDFEDMEQSSDLNVEATDNDVFAPEPVRIVLKPPWTRRGPQEHFPKFPHIWGRPFMPTIPIKASKKKFYPSFPPPRRLLPHQEDLQPYPVTQSAFFPKSYSQDLYALPGFGHHLESAEDAPVNLGELIALLGLQCSIKINWNKVRRLGGCKLPMADEYCPKTCWLCTLPARIAESLPPCKDELDTCENLAAMAFAIIPIVINRCSKKALRTYCAKSCGHCHDSQYYMNDAMYRWMPRKKQKKPPKLPLG